MNALTIFREAAAHRGKRLEYFTIAWNSLEGLIGIGAGTLAGSISLVGFGIDSLIEVTSEATLLWRMSVDADSKSLCANAKTGIARTNSNPTAGRATDIDLAEKYFPATPFSFG